MSQTKVLTLQSDLGDDVLRPVRFEYESELNKPFRLEIEMRALQDDLGVDKVLGKALGLRIMSTDGSDRWLHGIVASMAYEGRGQAGDPGDRHQARWRVVVRPWIWLLGRGQNSRIFQEMTAPEIVAEVFREAGFSDFEESLNGTYSERQYCVQYRESDLDFVQRLLREEGIRYWIRFEDGKNIVVLCDSKDGHTPVAGYETVAVRPRGDQETAVDRLEFWHVSHSVHAAAVMLDEYDFTAPTSDMVGEHKISREHENGEIEHYDYPGTYAAQGDGRTLAQVRAEQLQAGYEVCTGGGPARGLSAGASFMLEGHVRADLDREYMIVRCRLTGAAQAEHSGSDAPQFDCSLTAVPLEAAWRPPLPTRRPIVHGPQTAEVVGPSGKDIWTDEHGRVKVQFHWDRIGERDENSSCWVRVSQSWAGDGWGSMHLPHIGQEVICEFLEGNPDRPIITGRVFNGDHATFEGLPDSERKSGFRDVAKNELVMDSTEGAEKIELRDTYGNELILDSKEKTATLRSPTHESVAVLGKSIEFKSLSDLVQHFQGDERKNIDGNSTQTVKGEQKKEVWGPFKIKFGADVKDITVGIFAGVKLANQTDLVVGAEQKVSKSRAYSIAHGKSVSLYKNVVEVDHTDKYLKVRGKSEEFIKRHKLEGDEREERLKKIDKSCDEMKERYEKVKESTKKFVSKRERQLSEAKQKIEKIKDKWTVKTKKAIQDAKETIIANVMKIKK